MEKNGFLVVEDENLQTVRFEIEINNIKYVTVENERINIIYHKKN